MNLKMLLTFVTFVGVGQFLIASIMLHQWLFLGQKSRALDRLAAARTAHTLEA